MAEFIAEWLISASQSVNGGSSAELEDPRWLYSRAWDLVLAVGWGSSVSSTRLFSPCSFPSSEEPRCMGPLLQPEAGLYLHDDKLLRGPNGSFKIS